MAWSGVPASAVRPPCLMNSALWQSLMAILGDTAGCVGQRDNTLVWEVGRLIVLRNHTR